MHFLQDLYSWIFMPEYVTFSVSADGKHFRFLGKVNNTVPENKWGNIMESFTLRTKPVRAKYVRVLGKSIINIPRWHKGRGHKAYIFADEITVK